MKVTRYSPELAAKLLLSEAGRTEGVLPSTTQRLDQRYARVETQRGELRRTAFNGKSRALGVDDFDVGDETSVITCLRECGGAPCRGERAFLRHRLLREELHGG